jgi:hypothetical protein
MPTHCADCSRIAAVADSIPKRGYSHAYTIEQLRAFRDVSAAHKLEWLESMRRLLERSLTPEKLEIMQRFRRGEL